jgi:hypothetical protein
MTTVMLVAAMVPMAMGEGPGAASRAGMAKVILGGQTLSLLLTLLVTPVAYSLWDDLTNFFNHRVLGRTGVEEHRESVASYDGPGSYDGPSVLPPRMELDERIDGDADEQPVIETPGSQIVLPHRASGATVRS